MLNNAYAAYKRQTIATMTPVEIIVKLYDECEKQINRGIYFIEQKDYASTTACLNKAYEVVNGLQSMLNMNISMSKDLEAMYAFFSREIMTANMKKDTEKLRALLPMIAELKDAFVQISKMSRDQIAAQARGGTASQ